MNSVGTFPPTCKCEFSESIKNSFVQYTTVSGIISISILKPFKPLSNFSSQFRSVLHTLWCSMETHQNWNITRQLNMERYCYPRSQELFGSNFPTLRLHCCRVEAFQNDLISLCYGSYCYMLKLFYCFMGLLWPLSYVNFLVILKFLSHNNYELFTNGNIPRNK